MVLSKMLDLLLLFQQGTTLQVPRKLYEYISLKKPILGVCDEGETEDIITRNNLGLTVRDDVQAIEDALTKIIGSNFFAPKNPGVEQYNNINLSRELERVFDQLLKFSRK